MFSEVIIGSSIIIIVKKLCHGKNCAGAGAGPL